MSIIIDPEFRDLIQPLTDEERTELEASIKRDGCRDALVCWGETLLDGHNRYEICTQLAIPYTTRPINFSDREAAKEWIICNQLARRNLSLYQRGRLVLRREDIIKARAKERQIAGLKKGDQAPVVHHGDERDSVATDDKLAEMAGTSHTTIHRIRVIENEGTPEAKEKLAQGKTTISREYRKIRKPKEKPRMSKPERIDIIRELSGQGFKADQIAPKVGVAEEHVRLLARENGIPLIDTVIGGVRKIDVNRVISETVLSAQCLTSGLELIDSRIDGVDACQIDGWIESLNQSVNALNRLISKLKRRKSNGQ